MPVDFNELTSTLDEKGVEKEQGVGTAIETALEKEEIMSTVNNPAHYGGKSNFYEAIKVISAWDVGFTLGNAVKYIARMGKKEGASAIDDCQKAIWYLNYHLEHELQGDSQAYLIKKSIVDKLPEYAASPEIQKALTEIVEHIDNNF